MTGVVVVVSIVFGEAALAGFSVPTAASPDLAAAVAAWAGVRARRGRDVYLAAGCGLAAGLFTGVAWTLPAVGAVATAAVSRLFRVHAAQRLGLRSLVGCGCAVLVGAGLQLTLVALFADVPVTWTAVVGALCRVGLTTVTAGLVFSMLDRTRLRNVL